MQFPTLELGIKVGESKTIVQPLVVTQNVRRSQSALTVPFDACLDSDNLSQWPISGCYSMEILANGEIRWQLYINNNSKNPVCEILYPRTMPVYFSPEAVLMYPHHAGGSALRISPPVPYQRINTKDFGVPTALKRISVT